VVYSAGIPFAMYRGYFMLPLCCFLLTPGGFMLRLTPRGLSCWYSICNVPRVLYAVFLLLSVNPRGFYVETNPPGFIVLVFHLQCTPGTLCCLYVVVPLPVFMLLSLYSRCPRIFVAGSPHIACRVGNVFIFVSTATSSQAGKNEAGHRTSRYWFEDHLGSRVGTAWKLC
jgi:hypothetical protein